MSDKLTHFDDSGRPRMVDISNKNTTARSATATGFVAMSKTALDMVRDRTGKKGDAAAAAELAGVIGAKKTADLIPLCHPLLISGVRVECAVDDKRSGVAVIATVKITGQTGVEMEALTAVSVACLTIYDMLKAIDRAMVIENIALSEKTGGVSGNYRRDAKS